MNSTLDHLRNPAFSSFLDLARWVAAWIVFVGHLRNPLFLGFNGIGASGSNPLILGWYFVTGWFGEAVIVFFVLSGYLVGGLGVAKFRHGTFKPLHYGIDRFSRLYVAFLPALLLTALLDAIGMRYFAASGLYDGSQAMLAEKLADPAFAQFYTLETFLGNLVMLQTFRFDSFGSNPPLWTISAEFWFYVAFGAALAILIAARSAAARMGGLAVVAIGLIVLLTPDFVYYLGLWSIGLAVVFMPSGRVRWPLAFAALLLGILLGARIAGSELDSLPFGQAVRDYGVAIAFACLLHAMRETQGLLLVRSARINKFLADFSFSLYLIHFPLMLFILGALYATGAFPGIRTGYSPSDANGLALYGLIIIIIPALAWLFSLATERQTWRLRAMLKSRIARTSLKPEV